MTQHGLPSKSCWVIGFKYALDNYIRRGYSVSMTLTKSTPPLTPAVFHILLALSTGERHGYGIVQEVAARTNGEVRLSAGTLYRSIQRILE